MEFQKEKTTDPGETNVAAQGKADAVEAGASGVASVEAVEVNAE